MQDPQATRGGPPPTTGPDHMAPPPHGSFHPTPQTNGKAVASLVFGILAWVIWFIPLLAAILAIALGNKARQEIQDQPSKGRGIAVAGIVLGWIYIALFVLAIIVMIVVGGFTALIQTVRG